MTAAHLTSQDAREQPRVSLRTLLDLSRNDRPVFAVDALRAEIVGASGPARAQLNLPADQQFPLALDSAMPAIAQLRARIGDPEEREHTLIFWLEREIFARTCRVGPLGNDTAPEMMLIRLMPSMHRSERHQSEITPQDDVASWTEAPQDTHDPFAEFARSLHVQLEAAKREPDVLPPERSDAETLKDIARSIREGLFSSSPAPEHAVIQTLASDTSHQWITDAPLFAGIPLAPAAPVPSKAKQTSDITLTATDLARLAHELKTPMTAIAAAAEIMRDQRLGAMGNARYLDYAADIHDSAQHALAVIAKLLNSNQTRNDESDHIALLDLNAIVARTVSTLQPLAEQRGLTLLFEPEDADPTVTASATSIRQILLNLLTNALKFTPPGGDVRVVTGYLPNGSVFLVVRDTGEGIEETALARAFSDQPEQQTARSGGGFGIGLPLVRYLIQDMGAAIEFDSAPGKGTVALVSFPRYRS